MGMKDGGRYEESFDQRVVAVNGKLFAISVIKSATTCRELPRLRTSKVWLCPPRSPDRRVPSPIMALAPMGLPVMLL